MQTNLVLSRKKAINIDSSEVAEVEVAEAVVEAAVEVVIHHLPVAEELLK